MLRTAAAVAVVGIVTVVTLRVVFGVVGGLVGVLLALAWLLLKLLLVAGLGFWVLKVLNPDAARRVRDALRGESL